jgi:phage replication initiation protein
LVDWLTFVVTDEGQAHRWRETLGNELEWVEKSSGNLGYRRSVRNGGIVIYYDHNEPGRGVCIAISGKGCRQLEATGVVVTWAGWSNLLRRLTTTPGVHLTRLDVAYDDRAGLLSMERVKEYVDGGQVVSRFKSAYTVQKKTLNPDSGQARGLTVNFGSRVSKVMSRFYDKAAEQGVEGHWVRCEIEAKDSHAMELAALLANCPGGEEGAVVAGVLRHYISFRERSEGDTNRSRWPESQWWLAFLGAVEKVRLAVGAPARTWEKTRAWVEQQVAPALAVLRLGAYSWEELLGDLLDSGENRLKPRHHKMVSDEKARLASFGVSNGLLSVAGGRTGF